MSVSTTILDLMLLESYSLSNLAISDISQYKTGLTITDPTIEITAPGFNKIALDFTPNSVNVFNSSNLNTNCIATTPLPDGIYTVKYSISPSTGNWVQKEFMRTSQIKCVYQRVFLSVDLNCSCTGDYIKLKNELRNVRTLIEGSIAAANDCNIQGSMDMYNKANSILSRLSKCQCNC